MGILIWFPLISKVVSLYQHISVPLIRVQSVPWPYKLLAAVYYIQLQSLLMAFNPVRGKKKPNSPIFSFTPFLLTAHHRMLWNKHLWGETNFLLFLMVVLHYYFLCLNPPLIWAYQGPFHISLFFNMQRNHAISKKTNKKVLQEE